MKASKFFLFSMLFVFLASSLVIPGLAAAQASQPKLVPTHVLNAGLSQSQGSSLTAVSTPPALRGHGPPINQNYDEQLGLTFTQNFTSIEYNVTAVEQTDPTLDTGPGYLLSGISSAGNWYQVGLSWDWSPGVGFAMSYEVFDSSGNSIYPTNGGGGLMGFSGAVNAGDNVTLNLYFNSGQVVMLAEDVETGASAQVTYTAAGSAYFVGQPNGDANPTGFFTGLMTEWYHGAPYYSNLQQVVFSSNFSISSAWMWMDEFNANNGQLVFESNATALSTFNANPTQLQEFAYSGITEYANALEYITGAPSNSSTTSTTSSSTTVTAATSTEIVTSTATVTSIVPTTVTQTATATFTQPVTTTVTSTQPTTVTDTTTSTAPPSTTTTTQTTTQTAPAPGALPSWSYALMFALLLAGTGAGYLLKSQVAKPARSSAAGN